MIFREADVDYCYGTYLHRLPVTQAVVATPLSISRAGLPFTMLSWHAIEKRAFGSGDRQMRADMDQRGDCCSMRRKWGNVPGKTKMASRSKRGFSKEKKVAHPKRFELLTPRFVVWCSIQLSYGCVCSGVFRWRERFSKGSSQ
jgi:hypothetical protein